MNLTRAQKVRLGAFLLAGLVLLVGGIVSLAGLQAWEVRDTYTVRFSESVSGLERSATVRYQGLRVGRVDAMRIAADDPKAIEVVLSLEADTPLFEGTAAVLDSSGITGLKTINLTPGDPRKARVKAGSRLPAGESFLDRVTGKAEAVAVKAEVIANQLARWTSDENRQRVEHLLDAVDKLVVDLDKTIEQTREPMIETMGAVTEVSKRTARLELEGIKTLASLRTEIEKTGAATRSTLRAVDKTVTDVDGKELNKTVVSARQAMQALEGRLSNAETGKTISELRVTLTETTRLLKELDLVVRAGREDFVVSLGYMRQSAEDLREFSRIIAQDPSVLLRGQEVKD